MSPSIQRMIKVFQHKAARFNPPVQGTRTAGFLLRFPSTIKTSFHSLVSFLKSPLASHSPHFSEAFISCDFVCIHARISGKISLRRIRSWKVIGNTLSVGHEISSYTLARF